MRDASVDNLRGLASLTVVLSHASGYIPFYFFPLPLVYAVAQSAYFAVVLFFVISGFLITTKLLESSDVSGVFSLSEFYIGRIARIGPCLLLFIIVACLAALMPGSPVAIHWPYLPHKLGCIFTFRFNVCLVTDAERFPRNWDPIWSLSIEEVFYLCFPALLLVLRDRLAILIAGLLGLVILGIWQRYVHQIAWASFANFGHLAIGAMTALLTFRTKCILTSKWFRLACQVAGASLIFYMFWRAGSSDALKQLVWEPVVICVASGLYLFGSVRDGVWPLSYRPRIVERFGVLSYEIYLFHMTFLLGTSGVGQWIIGLNEPHRQKLLAYAWTATFLAVMLIGSAMISRSFSRPSDLWIKAQLGRVATRFRRQFPADDSDVTSIQTATVA